MKGQAIEFSDQDLDVYIGSEGEVLRINRGCGAR